ncbi:MAG: hypothetical protein QM785_00205 [Pyrinomonadaceae bacterium]
MKKLLFLSLMLGAVTFVAPAANAATTASSTAVADPQIRVQIGNQRDRRFRNNRTRTYTRIVTIGRNRYRETVRTTYFNGRMRTQVLSRVRIGRAW